MDVKAELLPRAPYDVTYTPDRAVAGFAFDIQTGSHAFARDRVCPFLTMPDSLALTPKGCDIRSRSDVGGEYLTVSLAPGSEERYLEGYDARAIRQFSNAAHKGAGTLARGLRAALLADSTDYMRVESYAVLLFEAALGARQPSAKPASSLTPRRMRRLHDLVEARYPDALTVTEIAAEVGLSVSYFIRAFAAATGTTPHAYLMERRLGEARRRLALSRESIASVATDCGFSSQAHMTSLFSRVFGTTPKAYRTLMA